MIFQRLIIPSSDNIFLEELSNDVNDVGYVDFVDETIDALLQRFPRHALVWYTAQSSVTHNEILANLSWTQPIPPPQKQQQQNHPTNKQKTFPSSVQCACTTRLK